MNFLRMIITTSIIPPVIKTERKERLSKLSFYQEARCTNKYQMIMLVLKSANFVQKLTSNRAN
jgi:hypothetical protein